MKNQSKLLVIFTILLIAIPFLSAVWWNPFTWFNEDTGEITEYETPYNETIEEPVLENNSVEKDFILKVSASDSGNVSLFVDDGSLVSWWRMDDEDVCDFCTPNLVNTSKTSWKDTTSCIDGFVNQSRNWTQYDYNDCGEVANETFFEYRTTSCGGMVLTAPTISLLNCRIPNTNPLCWFYSFGMSLISKNIILINGGILNII